MDDSIRAALSAALTDVSKRFARVLAEPLAEVAVHETRFLTRHRIYRVDYVNPPQAITFYVGYAPGGPAYLLTGRSAEFVRLARADGVAIDDPTRAAEYATAYLETTRSMSELFYVVRSVDDLRFRPNLVEEEEQARAEVAERYRDVIAPPAAEARDGGYTATVYAVREQALERHEPAVDRDGGIADNATTLETNLPLVYGS